MEAEEESRKGSEEETLVASACEGSSGKRGGDGWRACLPWRGVCLVESLDAKLSTCAGHENFFFNTPLGLHLLLSCLCWSDGALLVGYLSSIQKAGADRLGLAWAWALLLLERSLVGGELALG